MCIRDSSETLSALMAEVPLSPEVLEQLKKANAQNSDIHNLKDEELLARFKITLNKGLTDEQAAANLAKYGANEFPNEKGTPMWVLILKQFTDLLVIILILAALTSFVLAFFEHEDEQTTAFVEPLVIIVILIANATVGVMQESSAEKAVEALKAYASDSAKLIRNGKLSLVDATKLVVGDVVDVEVGDRIPADIRLLTLGSSTMDVEQAMLTGESQNVGKHVKPLDIQEAQIQDKTNCLFSGTTITRGKGRGVVFATGIFTEKGKIRERLAEKTETKFPLKQKLDEFGTLLSKSIGVVCVVVWLINIGHFSDPAFGGTLRGAVYYFKIAVSLAVAAIPEGLPAVVTTCLALGTQRMAKKNAIVTVLPAVETLGCTSVICSDKTGTLTTNQMSVQQMFVVGPKSEIVEVGVEGSSYATFKIKAGNAQFSLLPQDNYESLKFAKGQAIKNAAALSSFKDMAVISSLCNDANIELKGDEFSSIGQSTEAAMKVLVEKIGLPKAADDAELPKLAKDKRATHVNKYWAKEYTKVCTLEFNRDRKSMGVLVKDTAGQSQLLVKGAWDTVLKRCTTVSLNGDDQPLSPELRDKITKSIEAYCTGENCFRCLVCARVTPTASDESIKTATPDKFEALESGMTFVGVVGILDPPREEVKPAIRECKEAGIRVIMITGDNISTATAICKKIGIIGKDEDVTGKAFTGAEFKKMSKKEKFEAVKEARLFARVEPVDKQDLVRCLHAHKKIVAMTGDGVNDAPALKEADIGIAMGSGTAVAKGAAKMVLADDNFTTIVAAVEEGRNIYNNTKQFIRYLICSNIGEVVAIFICAVWGLPEVLLPVQLLWVNLVTDGLPAVALGFNKPEDGIMSQPPRPHDEPIVSRGTFFRFLVTGVYIGIATTLGMVWWFTMYENGPGLQFNQLFLWNKCSDDMETLGGLSCDVFDDAHANTMSLSVLVTIEMFCALNSLSERNSIIHPHQHPFTNLYLLGAMTLSFSLHFVILYIPFLAKIFSVAPLGIEEWIAVLVISAPVILLEEIMKFFLRMKDAKTRVKVD
eukprot:TRINITY_DN725_c0_g1_i1.p1 TRINITY_DN725_c0_g1~~TRINITY_DN725_c0_g1_i1.p1  ORF type:complete len:1045 (+),score=320.11 TRINITY_DN725_c0_g1_i1:39-3173(+)